MAEIQWIKLSTDFFTDRKIRQIRALPDGDAILLIWLNLLVLAGLVNDGGMVYLTQGVPYTEEMLAEEMKRGLPLVRSALTVFRKLHMIEDTPDGLLISNWEKHQNIDGMDRAREQSKLRMRKYRERQRIESGQNPDSCVTVTQHVTPCSTDVTLQNKNKNKKEEYIGEYSDEYSCKPDGLQNVISAWNALNINPIVKLSCGSNRYKMLMARLREYGESTVLEAISKISESSFLKGQNNTGWMISFDWFVKPNNFCKVLEGQYSDNQRQSPTGRESSVDRLARLVREGAFND